MTTELYWTTLEELYHQSSPNDPYACDRMRQSQVRYTPYGWCLFIMAATTLQHMRDTVCLVHGPLNCNASVRSFMNPVINTRGTPFLHMPTTAMDRQHIIFGAEGELYDAVLAVDKDYQPKLIVILTCCAPGITLDDIPRVVEKAQPLVKAKIVHFPSAGFDQIYGFKDDAVVPYVSLMDHPQRIIPNAVNILGVSEEQFAPHCVRNGVLDQEKNNDYSQLGGRKYPADVEELGRYIEALGLKVHRALIGGDYDYVRTAPEVAANVICSGSWGFPLAIKMKEKFGTPYIPGSMPLGVEASSLWIRDLARFFGREERGEKLIATEYADIKEVWKQCQEMVTGKTAIIQGNLILGLSWGRMCHELGMETIHVDFGSDDAGVANITVKQLHHDVEYYLSMGYNPKIPLINGQPLLWGITPPEAFLDKIGVDPSNSVYLYTDFPPRAKAGLFEPSNAVWVDSSPRLRRRLHAPGRFVGFRGTKALCKTLIESVMASQRQGRSPTLYGRLYGRPLNNLS
ncbi:MAG: hypothetical protein HY664_05105 [Chloroflexi bacterium]|nr:hypothetical protein [Chloroflexota bacterium]